jgi:hypothetical protein
LVIELTKPGNVEDLWRMGRSITNWRDAFESKDWQNMKRQRAVPFTLSDRFSADAQPVNETFANVTYSSGTRHRRRKISAQ